MRAEALHLNLKQFENDRDSLSTTLTHLIDLTMKQSSTEQQAAPF